MSFLTEYNVYITNIPENKKKSYDIMLKIIVLI